MNNATNSRKAEGARSAPRPASVHPEVRFRGMAPSESLLELAREQDALLRSVLRVDGEESRVVIESPRDKSPEFQVQVQLRMRGAVRYGCFVHRDARVAMRSAYSELLRHPAQETPCPCRNAA